jgi:hypothetical protein
VSLAGFPNHPSLFRTGFAVVAALCAPLQAQNIVKVTGHGEAAVDPREKKAANENALRRAKEAARNDAIEQVVAKVYGNKGRLGPKADELILKVAQRSEGAIRERIEKTTDILDGKAIVDIEFHVDRQRIKDYLEEIHDVSLTREAEGKLLVYVVAYTVEGVDPDLNKPIVLRDEVTDNRQNVQRSSFAGSRTDASSRASSASDSLQASTSSSSKGDAKQQSEGRFEGSRSASGSYQDSESASARAQAGDARARADYNSSTQAKFSADAKVKAGHSESASKAWDDRSAASVDARSAQASSASNYQQRSASGSSYSDTSTQYHSLKIYADPTKKGPGSTNHVKGVLEEMLRTVGMDVRDLDDLRVPSGDFKTTDALKNHLLNELKRRADFPKDAFVAFAINSLTPTDSKGSKYGANVSFHVRRVGDGYSLWNKESGGNSYGTATSDNARLDATQDALRKVGTQAAPDLAKAIQKWQREGQRQVQTQASEYLIQINDANNPVVASKMIAALKAAGFAPERTFDGTSRTVRIKVNLNGRRGEDVQSAVEPLLDSFDVDRLDAAQTILRVK